MEKLLKLLFRSVWLAPLVGSLLMFGLFLLDWPSRDESLFLYIGLRLLSALIVLPVVVSFIHLIPYNLTPLRESFLQKIVVAIVLLYLMALVLKIIEGQSGWIRVVGLGAVFGFSLLFLFAMNAYISGFALGIAVERALLAISRVIFVMQLVAYWLHALKYAAGRFERVLSYLPGI